MKDAGFDYSDPVSAYLDNRWSQSPDPRKMVHTADEVATAAADLRCKRSTNLVGTAIAVQAAYDERYITANKDALTTFRNNLTDRLHRAAEIISSASNG